MSEKAKITAPLHLKEVGNMNSEWVHGNIGIHTRHLMFRLSKLQWKLREKRASRLTEA